MASPRPIAPIAQKRPDNSVLSHPNATPDIVLSSSPSVPQIPARSSISSASGTKAGGGKGRSPSFNDPAFRPNSKPSTENLRQKLSTSPGVRRLSRPGGDDFDSTEPSVGAPSRAARLGLESEQASGASTPRAGEGGAAGLASEFTDQDKAKVLRRHLVSAEARSARQSPAPGEIDVSGGQSESGVGTPLRTGKSPVAGVSSEGDAPASSGSGSSGETATEFPIPYDEPGADVT